MVEPPTPKPTAEDVLARPPVLVGRQAILDHERNVFGYELLYRDSSVNQANVDDGDEATAIVMVNAFMEVGLDDMATTGRAFVNMTQNSFLRRDHEALPRGVAVLELPDSIEPTEQVIECVREARDGGYGIALDNFVVSDERLPLLAHADFVKVDVLAFTEQELIDQVEVLTSHPVTLVAEKVEDEETFQRCMRLGFDYFQGYFFCRPQILRGVRLSGNRVALMRLLAKLQDRDIKIAELETLVASDLALSLRLLRFVNSAAAGLHREVASIDEAVAMVGTERIRRWASLLVLANTSDKPSELIRVALVRGRMCEGLAGRHGSPSGSAFTVGLFSVLDAYFDTPMEVLLADLPLPQDLTSALTDRTGQLGGILECVVLYEQGEWEQAMDISPSPDDLGEVYVSSAKWADEVMKATLSP